MAKGGKKSENATMAVQISDNKKHVVGIGGLRVMLIKEDQFWIAQGLEIDSLAQGSSKNAAKKNFEDGLRATIGEHLKIYGTIERLLSPAPKEVWQEFFACDPSGRQRYAQISVHRETSPKVFRRQLALAGQGGTV